MSQWKVIDDDYFPSSTYRTAFEADGGGAESINGAGLFWRFILLKLQCKGMVMLTLLTIVLDQMENLYYFGTLYLSIYTVDVIFNVHPESAEEVKAMPASAFRKCMLNIFL